MASLRRIVGCLDAFDGREIDLLIGKKEAEVRMKVLPPQKTIVPRLSRKTSAHTRPFGSQKPQQKQKKLSGQSALWSTRRTGHRVKCPACGSDSLVTGTPVAPPNQKLKQGMIVVTQSFLPSKFECIACGLKIAGLPQLHACDLPMFTQQLPPTTPSNVLRTTRRIRRVRR